MTMFSIFKGKTPPIVGGTERSLATLEAIHLGGARQWVTIRSHDTANPILLYVHGGPGMSDMGAIRHFVPRLEEQFTVVHWSQRGAGKSYSAQLPTASMTVGQFVDDLEELTRYLLERFGQQKLFLVGQSWGTLLCMRLVKRAPELFHAYVGVNQVVDRPQEELISYRATLDQARRLGRQKAVTQLEALGEPVDGHYATLEGTLLHKTWARTLGIVTYDPKRFTEFGKAIMLNPELTCKDLFNLFRALRWNMELLWGEFCSPNLRTEIAAVEVPIYFVAGRHDRVTSPQLQAEYLDDLQAPAKEFILFDHAAHIACFEEPDRFYELMLSVRQRGTRPE